MALYETNALLDQSVLDMKAHVFQFDAVFSERTSFDEFYSRTVQWNVKDAMNGGLGAILLLGSDNFERSHTLSNIERKVSVHNWGVRLAQAVQFARSSFCDRAAPGQVVDPERRRRRY